GSLLPAGHRAGRAARRGLRRGGVFRATRAIRHHRRVACQLTSRRDVHAHAIEIEEARELVLEHVSPLASENVELHAALGRVLAEAVESAGAVPAFDGSAMDGFAVRAADTRGAGRDAPVTLRTVDESRAGRPAARSVEPGLAIAISTGAAMPNGAD